MKNIVQLVTRYAKPTSYSDGQELAIPCPWHDRGRDPQKKLWLNVNKRIFICYKCDERGTFRKLLYKLRQIKPDSFADLDQAALDAISDPVDDVQAPIVHEGHVAKLPDEFKPLWGTKLSRAGKVALRYLHNRGLDEDTIELYRIGYCELGEFAYRVIVPTYEDDRLVYWLGRDFTDRQEIKVKNPLKSQAQVGSKEWVFNLNFAEEFKDLVINEGVFDAIATGLNAVALFGKTASAIQVKKIVSRPFKTITVMLDADAHDAGLKLGNVLTLSYAASATMPEIKVARLPRGDPNSVPREVLEKALVTAERVTCL